jgi:hypothetical protein
MQRRKEKLSKPISMSYETLKRPFSKDLTEKKRLLEVTYAGLKLIGEVVASPLNKFNDCLKPIR